MTTSDHADHADQSREDWWTAFTDWLSADRAGSGPLHDHRVRLDRDRDHRYRGPDAQVHRGPDGKLYYGCCVPAGSVRIDDLDGEPAYGSHWPRERVAEHTAGDHPDDADDAGDGW